VGPAAAPTQILKHRFGHANLVVLSKFFHCSAKVAAKQNKNVNAQRKTSAKKAKMSSVKEKTRICAFSPFAAAHWKQIPEPESTRQGKNKGLE
jgi:hypothetical protein